MTDHYDLLDRVLPRYLRWLSIDEPRARVKHVDLQMVRWLPNFYAYPGFQSISQPKPQPQESPSKSKSRSGSALKLVDPGSYFHMDAASALAVACLGINWEVQQQQQLLLQQLQQGIIQPLSIQSESRNFPTQQPPIKVLDLCCCPGAKFQLLASQMNNQSSYSSSSSSSPNNLLVGVDNSSKRLEVRNL